MNLGEFLSIISDKSILIFVVAESGIHGVNSGAELYSGEIYNFENYEISPDLFLDELYVDTIDVNENGVFTVYVC
jgi:hypothetical protein